MASMTFFHQYSYLYMLHVWPMKCKANEKPKSLAIHDVKIVIESVDLEKLLHLFSMICKKDVQTSTSVLVYPLGLLGSFSDFFFIKIVIASENWRIIHSNRGWNFPKKRYVSLRRESLSIHNPGYQRLSRNHSYSAMLFLIIFIHLYSLLLYFLRTLMQTNSTI